MKREEDYVTIRIPRQLAQKMDEIIQSGTLGYKTRAEMVKEAIRLRIESIRSTTQRDLTRQRRKKKISVSSEAIF